jgi:hypothetical protein
VLVEKYFCLVFVNSNYEALHQSCTMAGFGIICVEPLGSATSVLFFSVVKHEVVSKLA